MRRGMVMLWGLLAAATGMAEPEADWKDRLSTLNTPNYTGGLPSKNRALAKQIRQAMIAEFPASSCAAPNVLEGVKIGNVNDQEIAEPDLAINNDDLRFLVDQLSNPSQEVRDTATYTLSLFGPVVDVVVPVLEAKRADESVKGNWYNHALSKISCDNWAAADFRRVIPQHWLPSEENWSEFLDQTEDLLVQLYQDPEVEYPPKMLFRNLRNYGFSDSDETMSRSLYDLVLNAELSDMKRQEAADLLIWKYDSITDFLTGDELINMTNELNEDLNQSIKDLLVKLNHPIGLEYLAEEMKEESLWGWSREICPYGEAGISLEDDLIEALYRYDYPDSKMDVMTSMACIKSKKAIPILRKMALSKHWELAKSAVESLGQAGRNTWLVRRTLKKVSKDTWSRQVRDAAQESLRLLQTGESVAEDEDVIRLKMGPASIDHGMPACEPDDQFSLDGQRWFLVEWVEESVPEPPAGFPAELISDYRTHVFYPVADGWLFGSEKGHYDGAFVFWSATKRPYYLSPFTDIYSIFEYQDEIWAIGYQVFADGDAGVVFKVKNIDGEWRAIRGMTLPSPPFGYAFGPDKQLLLKDHLNHYALIGEQIIPLRCRTPNE